MKQEISPSVPPSSPLPKQIFHCSHQPHLPLCKDPSLQYPVLFQWRVVSSQPQLVLFFRYISDIFGGENRNTCTLLFLLTSQMLTTYQKHFFQKISLILLRILHFRSFISIYFLCTQLYSKLIGNTYLLKTNLETKTFDKTCR